MFSHILVKSNHWQLADCLAGGRHTINSGSRTRLVECLTFNGNGFGSSPDAFTYTHTYKTVKLTRNPSINPPSISRYYNICDNVSV